MKTCGIYKITNKVNNKCIIGSSKKIENRWCEYRNKLRKGSYENSYLQRSWNKYSEQSFEFTIIEVCPESDLIIREQYWMDFYKSMDKNIGYNQQAADRHVTYTKRYHSEETKRKIGLSSKGRKQSKEDRLKKSLSHLGRKHTKEHNKNNSKAQVLAHLNKKLFNQLNQESEFIIQQLKQES